MHLDAKHCLNVLNCNVRKQLSRKKVCMFHGGKSTGPAMLNSKRRCAEAKTIHGRETRVIRTVRAKN